MKNGLDEQYINLLKDILENGVEKDTRNGKTLSVFGRTIKFNFKDGKFPLLTTKKMYTKGVITELLWFLRGDTNIKYLVDNDCHIWDGDAYKNYCENADEGTFSRKWLKLEESFDGFFTNEEYSLYTQEEFINKIKTDDEFAEKWGDLGRIYGAQWRDWLNLKWEATDKVDPSRPNQPMLKWNIESIDQIANLINDLKTNPDSRRLMVSAWNVGELDQMTLPPCHFSFQVYTRELSLSERMNLCKEKWDDSDDNATLLPSDIEYRMNNEWNIPKRAISLMWNQRSVDTFLGLPFNIASYGLLLEIIAKEVNMVPDELIGNLGDVHLYSNHIDQAKEQIGRELTDEERYNIWFTNNYETGMERYFDPNNLPDYDDEYYEPTPTRSREPYPLPTLKIEDEVKWKEGDCLPYYSPSDFTVEGYQSHPTIKAPLSN